MPKAVVNLGLLFSLFCWGIPLSIGQQNGDWTASHSTSSTIQQVSKVISTNASKMVFGQKNTQLAPDTEGGRNKSFDQLLAYFEKSDSYRLVIRVKNGRELSKQRIAFLYSYIFKNTNLKAQHVEIKPFTPKDGGYFWTFENDEIAVSFDLM